MSKIITKPLKSVLGLDRYKPGGSRFDPAMDEASALMLARAKGDRPSVAQEQSEQALDTNLSNTISALRSAPGISPALKGRLIADASMGTGQEIAKQA